MLSKQPQTNAIQTKRINYLHVLQAADITGPFLEIGPGNGEMLTIAKEAGFLTISVADIDEGVVERIRHFHPDVCAHFVDVNVSLPTLLGTAGYSCIVACHVIEHIGINQRLAALTDWFTMLKPGGIIILELPNPLCVLGGWSNYLADPTHQLPLSSSGLKKLVSLAGFSNIEAAAVKPVATLSRSLSLGRWAMSVLLGAFANLLARTCDIRTPSFYVTARRPE